MNPDPERRLAEAGAQRVLVLDGAYGTQFRAAGLPEAAFRDVSLVRHPIPLAGNYEVLNLTRPHIVRGLHDAYLAAGADIVETNTFNANAIIQADFGLADRAVEMARAGASLARAAADAAMAADPSRPRFVAGALGVTRRDPARRGGESPPGIADAADAELHAACAATAKALITHGVDLILIETVTSLRNARLALAATRDAMAALGMTIPIAISATIDAGGQLESGDTIEAFAKSLAGERLHALGLNCALGASDLAPHIERLAASTPARLWLYPNAGYPDDAGRYREPAGVTAAALGDLAARGLVNAVGGCCGTTPAHIAAIAEAVNDLRPRAARRPRSIPR